jgi:hypothetical protein
MALDTRRTPERQLPIFSGVIIEKVPTSNTQVLSTAGGVVTMSAAQALGGLLKLDCQDAQTITTPTAAVLVAAIPGCEKGNAWCLDIVNYGDSTATVGLGTGVTLVALAGVDSIQTIATTIGRRFRFIVTGVAANGDSADAVVLEAVGCSAALVS